MAEFRAFEPQVEVLGDVVLSLVRAMGAFRGLGEEILERHGLGTPLGHLWYPQQAWLDAFSTISQEVGPTTLIQIGRQVPRQAQFRPGLHHVADVLLELDTAYQRAHRGGNAGFYKYEPRGLRSGRIVCHTPYPCEFEQGLVDALATRFAPQDAIIDLRHEGDGTACKKLGHDACSLHLMW